MQFNSKRFNRLLCVVAFCSAATCLTLSAIAQPPAPPPRDEQIVKIVGERTDLEIIEKFVKVVELKDKITRVDGFDPTVVDVSALSARRIRIQANAQGVTTVVLTDEFGNTFLVEVFVKGDARHLQAIINTKFPDSAIEALKVRESVVLRGWVTKPEDITQIVEIAEQFYPRVLNQMKVGGVQQVKLKVKVMEVQRTKIREMGINFLYINQNGFLSSTPGQLTQLSSIILPFGGGASASFDTGTLKSSSVAFGLVDNNNAFQAFINALKQEALLKILAEPEIVTTNGRPATVLSGGEFPILVPQSLGTTTIEWRPFGVRLEAVPIILGGGQLRLELEPEVSERDFTNAVQLNNLTVPGLTTRRVNTQVEMKFGQTLMIAGLIASRNTAETSKIPFFGELPWIGTAFSRKRYDEVETELVVMVTPELVAPLEADQIPPGGPGRFTDAPTDRELYFYQMLEVPKYGNECEGCEVPEGGLIGPDGMPQVPGMHMLPQSSQPPAMPAVVPGSNGTQSVPVVPPSPDQTEGPGGNSMSRRFSAKFPSFGAKNSTRNDVQQVQFQDSITTPRERLPMSPTGPARQSLNQQVDSPKVSLQSGRRPGLIEPKPGMIAPPMDK